MRQLVLIFLLSSIAAACARSQPVDEPNEKPATLIHGGYEPVPTPIPHGTADAANRFAPHALAWPVAFQDERHEIGNSMAEFQPFGDPYWHGGCDLRVIAGAEVRAPVSGKIEAGHYSYATNSDGSMTKYWLPWPAAGNDTYFEVAIVTDDGTRFEFHHIDRLRLPAHVADLVKAKGRVSAGETIGFAITWPDGDYHHIHYNIVAKSAERINPEYVSTVIADSVPPKVSGLYAIFADSSVHPFGNGSFSGAPAEFVADVADFQDKNVYAHPPSLSTLRFASGQATTWDFRRSLTRADGTFPALWDFFKTVLTLPSGQALQTSGGYGTGSSLVRLKVPAGAAGPFEIQFGDQNDNVISFDGEIQP